MTLVIMAAGMGSRYGGLKQIDPITPQGAFILDFSIYDALLAGFDTSSPVFSVVANKKVDMPPMPNPGAGMGMM